LEIDEENAKATFRRGLAQEGRLCDTLAKEDAGEFWDPDRAAVTARLAAYVRVQAVCCQAKQSKAKLHAYQCRFRANGAVTGAHGPVPQGGLFARPAHREPWEESDKSCDSTPSQTPCTSGWFVVVVVAVMDATRRSAGAEHA